MVTSDGPHVINASPDKGDDTGVPILSAAQAAEHAGITYRQLDYWARQGWVTPSVESEPGRRRRRRYSVADVARLGALGHFGRAGLDVGLLGEPVGSLALDSDLDEVVIARVDGRVEVAPGPELRARLTEQPEAAVVFDPQRLYRSLGAGQGNSAGLELIVNADRRSA